MLCLINHCNLRWSFFETPVSLDESHRFKNQLVVVRSVFKDLQNKLVVLRGVLNIDTHNLPKGLNAERHQNHQVL